MMVLRRARSGPASEDLMEAAALCRAIVQAGGAEPPWPPPPERALAFERVFVEQLTEQELRVMRTGYATARAILSHRSASLARLVALLFYRPVVRGEDLHPVLGPRPVASTSLWITLSDEVRAEFTLPPGRSP